MKTYRPLPKFCVSLIREVVARLRARHQPIMTPPSAVLGVPIGDDVYAEETIVHGEPMMASEFYLLAPAHAQFSMPSSVMEDESRAQAQCAEALRVFRMLNVSVAGNEFGPFRRLIVFNEEQ